MSIVQVKYKILFTVKLMQQFYSNGFCRNFQSEPVLDFEFMPTEQSVQLMNRKDLIYRPTPFNGGFIVLARVLGTNAAGDELLRFPISSTDKLVFLVLLKNAEMLNSAELPVKWAPDRILYLTNTRVDPLAPRDKLHLTSQSTGVDAVNDFIKQSGPAYRFTTNGTLQPGQAKVKHLDTGLLLDPATLNAENGKTSLSFNLSSIASGLCQLLVNNVNTDEFYLINATATGTILAVVDISLSSALQTNYRVIEADRSLIAQRPVYESIFPNRKSKWRYSIHLQPDSPLAMELKKMTAAEKALFLANVNIETNDNQVSFQKVTANENDFVFESVQPLQLKENYFSSNHPKDVLNLRLRKYIGLGPPKEGDIRAFLPYPSTHQLDATNQASIYSNIFLTI